MKHQAGTVSNDPNEIMRYTIKESVRYTIFVPKFNKLLGVHDDHIVTQVLGMLKEGATAKAESNGIWTNSFGEVCEDKIVPIEVVVTNKMDADEYVSNIAKHIAELMGHDWVFVTKEVVYIIRHASTILARSKITDVCK